MLDQSPRSDQVHELDGRLSDGIHVRLLWRSSDGRVWVAVSDTKTGEAFSVPVGPGERALEVFDHPYAYASWARRQRAAAASGLGGPLHEMHDHD